ncbi:hypothetical protein [Xanthomonas floridensis]|uniref:Uncharacterized protein n=1 Tax=Xanthomonas floridensis TaxID=1843580 RepID=A0ABU5Q0W2_9XANT|nr:hypothetical protein [Xanthomonas floridensis]MEA5125509.1 hypothetical protein [Xanthomonas floridensis]MEA5133318.1 hypothetical protein [Xanthomonas floridensis]
MVAGPIGRSQYTGTQRQCSADPGRAQETAALAQCRNVVWRERGGRLGVHVIREGGGMAAMLGLPAWRENHHGVEWSIAWRAMPRPAVALAGMRDAQLGGAITAGC